MGDEEKTGSYKQVRPAVLPEPKIEAKPVKIEVAERKVPVRLLEGVSTQMATLMANFLYPALVAAKEQGVKDLEFQKMAGMI